MFIQKTGHTVLNTTSQNDVILLTSYLYFTDRVPEYRPFTITVLNLDPQEQGLRYEKWQSYMTENKCVCGLDL